MVQGWGSKMLAAVSAVAELAAEGFGLPRTAFSDLMACGPHLLAPTGDDQHCPLHGIIEAVPREEYKYIHASSAW